MNVSPVIIEESLENLVKGKILLKVLYDLDKELKIKQDEERDGLGPVEWRYEFANSRISSGIRVSDYIPGLPKEDIIYRVFMPDALALGTLTASGSKDFVALQSIDTSSQEKAKKEFIEEILKKRNYRKLTKREHARLQGFPDSFKLHETEATSNKQMGNAVTVHVIRAIGKVILEVMEPELFVEYLACLNASCQVKAILYSKCYCIKHFEGTFFEVFLDITFPKPYHFPA